MHRNERITKAQHETLNFIRAYTAQHKFAPTITEIRNHFGLKSLRSVTQRLDALQRKGLILREKFKQRGIMLLDELVSSFLRQIPVIGFAGADNMNRVAEQLYDEYVMVDASIAGPRTEMVAIRVAGRSMEDAGIFSGDYVIVEPTEHPRSGELVVAIIGEMSVVKRFRDAGDAIILSPETKAPGHSDIVLKRASLENNFRIFGRVLSVLPASGEPDNDDVQIVPLPGE